MGGTLLLARFNRQGLQQAALSAMNNTGLVGASSSSAAANSQTSAASIETKLNNLNLSSSIPEERMSNRLQETLRNDPGLNCLKDQLSRVNAQIQMHEELKLRVAKAEKECKHDMEAKAKAKSNEAKSQTTPTTNPWVKY